MASTGTVIFGADYNTVQVKAEGILGSGSYYGGPSNGYGYGQSVVSSTVTPTSLITAAQWDNLVEDLNKSYLHQNGTNFTGYSTLLTNISNTNPITYDNLAIMSDIGSSIVTNRLNVNAGQLTLATGSDQYVPFEWGKNPGVFSPIETTVQQTQYTSSGGINGLHNFFNAGGKIRIVGITDTSLYTETDQENAWVSLVSTVDFEFDYTDWQTTFNSGSEVTLLNISSSTTPYTGANITIRAAYQSSGAILFLTVRFTDGHTAIGAGPDTIRANLVGVRRDIYSPSGAFTIGINKTDFPWGAPA